MKLNILEHLHGGHNGSDIIATALIHAITYTNSPEGRAVPNELLPDKEGNMDVQLIVNGVELSFETIMTQFEENCERAIKHAAIELVSKKASHMINVLEDMKRQIEMKAMELFPDMDIQKED